MADADQQETSQETAEKGQPQGNKVDQQLAEIARMLAEQNQKSEATLNALADQVRASKQTQVEEDADPVYDSKRFKSQVLDEADKIAQRAVARERALNTVVYQMSQEFPEIATDPSLKKAITEFQRALPEGIRETADGYETAILKAVHKAGLIPKSKRQANLDEDISMGNRGSEPSTRSKRAKVSEETLAVAHLLAEATGRKVDEKVLKGLEEAAQRTVWNRYK